MSSSQRFLLPKQGQFSANGPDDPLPYYYSPIVGWLYRARIEQGMALLAPPYSRILEIGYGSGVLLPSLCRLGEEVWGVDLESNPAAIGASLQGLGLDCTLYRGDIADAAFPDHFFDLVVAFSIFEHIADPGPVLDVLHRLLVPGGTMLVGMPRVDRLMSRAFALIGFPDIDAHHITDHHSLLATAQEHGFTVRRQARMFSLLPAWCGLYFSMLLENA